MDRRTFLTSSGILLADQVLWPGGAEWAANKMHAHYALRIEPFKLEIAPGVLVETIAYNGQVPGPILRVREGVPVTVDVTNHSKCGHRALARARHRLTQ
jgi:FtsP/CotA-like multicopper oxidase with cupredoxin domain